jgi:hypothetical protein
VGGACACLFPQTFPHDNSAGRPETVAFLWRMRKRLHLLSSPFAPKMHLVVTFSHESCTLPAPLVFISPCYTHLSVPPGRRPARHHFIPQIAPLLPHLRPVPTCDSVFPARSTPVASAPTRPARTFGSCRRQISAAAINPATFALSPPCRRVL